MKTLRQIFAIARTEFRFGLRRGAPVVVTAMIGLIVGAGILLTPLINLNGLYPDFSNLTTEQIGRLAERGITVDSFRLPVRDSLADSIALFTPPGWELMLLALLFLPVATSMTIPADRTFGVQELLRSTPISGTTYLAGKILGVLGIVLFIGLFPLLLFFSVIEIALLKVTHYGLPFYLVKFFIKLTFMDGLPLFVFGSVVGVLTGVAFRTRRGAIFPGFVIGILSLFFWIVVFKTPPALYAITDAAAYSVFQGYTDVAPLTYAKVFGGDPIFFSHGLLGEGAPIMGIGPVVTLYLVILGLLLLLASLARLWLHWKENF